MNYQGKIVMAFVVSIVAVILGWQFRRRGGWSQRNQ